MLIYLDTETTGVSREDRLCQLAYKSEDGITVVNEYFKPPLSIKYTAMEVSHITQKMVDDKPAFKDSLFYAETKDLLSISTVIAHNAEYDLNMLKKENIECMNHICTFKIACYLDPEGKLEKYSMQYLRYKLGIDIEATPHNAYGDILVLEQLYLRLAQKLSVDEMIEISKKPALLPRLSFGKHRGKLVKNIDAGYLGWICKQNEMDPNVKYTAEYWLGKHK